MTKRNRAENNGRFGRVVFGLVAAVMMASGPATGQGDRGDFGGRGGGFGGLGGFAGFEQPIGTRDVQQFERILGLTEEQKLLVDALFEGYAEQVRDQQRKMRDAFSGMRERLREGDATLREEVQNQMAAIREEGKRIEASFLADVRSVLTEAQTAAWPKVEMTLRRERTLRRGLMSGERVNVIRLIDEADLGEDVRAAISPTLEQYEVDLDRALVERNRFQEEAMEAARELMQSGDFAAIDDLFSRGREFSRRVRDVNRRYARQIISMLPEEKQAEVEQAFKAESFPEAYRPTFAARRLESALGLADLTAEQKEAIESLRSSFTQKMSQLNDRLAKAIEEGEESFSVRQMFDRGGNRGERPPRPGDDVRTERRALDEATTESLTKILTPEQVKRLPEREDRGRGDRFQGQREGDGRGNVRF